MATDAAASASSRTLPALGTYLRTLFDLGRRSIPAALPALLFLWFYRFGTELYLELAQGTSRLGYPDTQAQLVQGAMKVSAYLPLLVLVYAPFLLLQDSLLAGERRGFLGAVRDVLERMIPFVLSVVLQLLIIVGPVLFVVGIVAGALVALPALPRELAAVIVVAITIPVVFWLLLSSYFLVFAIPGVILSGLGPARSISASVRLVGGHFWGILGRFIVFFLILIAAVAVISIPSIILTTMGAATAQAVAFRIAGVLWSSLLAALTFPFWAGALIVLYRALVPAGAGSAVDEPAPGVVAPHPGAGETSTPFLFE